VDDLFHQIKTSPPAPGYDEILIPGELERRSREKLLREGIYIEEKTWKEIQMVGRELEVEVP
jgi:LDH2 family malate/lactate/ureidoglycolate dehydrogenase